MIRLEFHFKLISKDNEKIRNKQGLYFLSRKYKDFDKKVRMVASAQYMRPMMEGPLKVTIVAYYKTKVHPDCFNLPKGVCDSLEGIIYKNDRQIRIGQVTVISESWVNDKFAVYIEEVKDAEFIKESISG